MEIFQDGELEAEMNKRELHANSLSTWWQLFSDTYEELVQSIACPVRAEYTELELGDQQFSIPMNGSEPHVETFVREDFRLRNERDEELACSFWRRKTLRDADPIADIVPPTFSDEEEQKAVAPPDSVFDNASTNSSSSVSSTASKSSTRRREADPCIIYLHGMSSSRKESVYLRQKVLAAGFSLFAVDLSGSGMSGGDRISFGFFERDDLRTVVDYLYATGRASAVGIWGRDVGAATALLHVKDRMPYRYETMTISKSDVDKLQVMEDKASRQILCVPTLSGLHFRFSKYSAQNGDFVLLAVGSVRIEGLSAEACQQLIQRSCKKARSGHVKLQGYKRTASSTASDKFIFALTVDSVYGDMEQVVWDMLEMISKSAERRSLVFPSAMVTAVQKILTNSIGKAGGFNFRDVRLLDTAPRFTLPCLFVSASKKDFFMPQHAEALFHKYGGPKSYVMFTGLIDDNRPADVLDTVISHFTERFKQLK